MRKWIDAFLASRRLSSPDGRHLFAYQMTPDEFRSLEGTLTRNIGGCIDIGKASGMPIDDVFEFGQDSVGHLDAAFVLYAAAWWQQRYDGKFAWQPVMDAVRVGTRWKGGTLTAHVGRGLSYWGRPTNDTGFRYLGAVALEAGLPLRLLHGHGNVLSWIFRSVLKEAVRSDAGRDRIGQWIDNAKTALPAAYRGHGSPIVGIMADVVVAIRDLRRIWELKGHAAWTDDCLNELSRIDSNWQERFPLPLFDEAALGLLRFLFREIDRVPSQGGRVESIVVRRFIGRTMSDDGAEAWNLSATVVVPDRCRLDGLPEGFASGALTFHLDWPDGGRTYDLVLNKTSDGPNVYDGRKDRSPVLSGAAAADDVVAHLTNNVCVTVDRHLPGGVGLDPDLPWVFEAGDVRNTLVRQGGGGVGSVSAYVALVDGWRVDGEAVERGRIVGLPRTVWEISGPAFVTDDAGQRFAIKTCDPSEACPYAWEGASPRFVRRPVNAFKGLPRPVRYLAGGSMSPVRNARLQWRYPSERVFSDAVPGQRFGVMDVWDRSPQGSNLRSRMLILPPAADVRFKGVGDRRGQVTLSGWQASDVLPASGQSSVSCHVEKVGDDHLVTVDAVPGSTPPRDVTLLVYWHGRKEHAEVVVPFPMKGARLFGPGGEIPQGGALCVSDLQGLSLYCFAENAFRTFELVFSLGGREFATPLVPGSDAVGKPFSVRLSGYRDRILSLLSLGKGIDAAVRMSVRCDGIVKGCSWTVRRYAGELDLDAGDILLKGACTTDGGHGSARLRAICLARPSAEPKEFTERESEGVPVGRWTIGDALDMQGPWLFYDADPDTRIRPKVVPWSGDGARPCDDADRLESAMLSAPTERAAALRSCLEAMACEPAAPEWETFARLTQTLGHLPLSTLDMWQAAAASGRVMAVLAMRTDVDFAGLTGRASSELAFLWETVSLDDWRHAAGHCEARMRTQFDDDLVGGILAEHLRKRRGEIVGTCRSCRVLTAAAFPIDDDRKKMAACKAHFKLPVFHEGLWRAWLDCLRRHADDDAGRWPRHYEGMVRTWRADKSMSRFFPPAGEFDACKDGVRLLPIVLGVRAWTGDASLLPLGPDDLFRIRRYMDFDGDWFRDCFEETILCCLAEHFTL